MSPRADAEAGPAVAPEGEAWAVFESKCQSGAAAAIAWGWLPQVVTARWLWLGLLRIFMHTGDKTQ
jgi:hypothetical protein